MNNNTSTTSDLCLVLLQSRSESPYNDFVGSLYHFPKKYLNMLSSPGTPILYYDPSPKGAGVYFGYGKLGNVIQDKTQEDHYFVEINGYREFKNPIPFIDENNTPRESGEYYNSQNSVRKIDRESFDNICLDAGVILNFVSDVNLIRVLGEQLISTEIVGFLELVKNAYDAGATYCLVKIENIPDQQSTYIDMDKGPTITIEDNGCGMDWFTIENGWLRPATPLKTNPKERLKIERKKAKESGNEDFFEAYVAKVKASNSGRIPLGEKGVGRFATQKLGNVLTIVTKTKEMDYELVMEIDWTLFENDNHSEFKNLDSVGISLKRQKVSRDYGISNSGTKLVIAGKSSTDWSKEKVLKIAEAIFDLQLNSPDDEVQVNADLTNMELPGFHPLFTCPQYDDYIQDERSRFDINAIDPVFFMEGFVDENGVFEYELEFRPPVSMMQVGITGETIKSNIDLRATADAKDNRWTLDSEKLRQPDSGPFLISVKAWYRIKELIDLPEWKMLTHQLDKLGGISLYRDDLKILRADDGSKTDWLGLNSRQIKQSYRISYYHMVGSVGIDQMTNIDLIDQTSRQGLIESRALGDLTWLVRASIIHVLEDKYIKTRNFYTKRCKGFDRNVKRLSQRFLYASDIVKRIAENYDVEQDPLQLLSDLPDNEKGREALRNLSTTLKNQERNYEEIGTMQELMAEMAGFGLSISIAIHELGKLASSIHNTLKHMIDKRKVDIDLLSRYTETLSGFRSELSRLEPFRIVRNELNKNVNMSFAVKRALELFEYHSKKLGIEITVSLISDFQLSTRLAMLTQIIGNLLDNSLYWLQNERTESKKILILIDGDTRKVIIADSGPGIHPLMVSSLFEPGFSLKDPPSGLGLYICRYYMARLHGSIRLATDDEMIHGYKGATFILEFPLKVENNSVMSGDK